MARSKRFKILKTAISKYKAPVSTPGTAFYVFDRFQKGLTDYHPNQPARGEVQDWKAKPFGVPSSETILTKIKRASTRSLATDLGQTGLVLTDLAVSQVEATDNVSDDSNYIPAKAIVFSGTTGVTNVSASDNKVTGVPYKRRNGSSFTLPFGQGNTPGTHMTIAMGYIADKIDEATGNKTVTFKPERFYGSGR